MGKVMKISSRNGVILTVILGIALISSLNFWQNPVKGFFYSSSASLEQALWGAGSSTANFFEGLFNSKKLQQENEQLRLTIQGLLSENSALKEAAAENITLKEALGVGLAKSFQLVLAEVVSQDIGQDTIMINQGKKDGMSLGLPVVTQEKVLLGKISEVYDKQSRVALITGEKSSFDAKVQGTSISGVVKGKGGAQLTLDLVPKTEELKEGDLLITTTLGGIYPKDLLIGTVRNAQQSDTEPFWQTEISPLFKADELSYIFVVTNF
jgi:rod shape-determining protein MreC